MSRELSASPGEILWAADLGLLPEKPRLLTHEQADFAIEVLAGAMNFEMAPTKGPAERVILHRLSQNPRVQDARHRMLALCGHVAPPRSMPRADSDESMLEEA